MVPLRSTQLFRLRYAFLWGPGCHDFCEMKAGQAGAKIAPACGREKFI